ncbi:aminopeptidase P family N-terminal domain-containing protein, partial [Salmonella enterica subsp. enterica serovar Virginia]|nr:aminopeptidase P family N-terminal domain-containing protein [Salmonella enterica subsp. enterica serovar Virginia]
HLLEEKQLDAVVVLSSHNRRYLSGFTGSSAGLIISKERNILVTDFRYIEQATKQAQSFEIVKQKTSLLDMITEVIKELELKTVGFEGNLVTYQDYMHLATGAELADVTGEIEKIRMIKEPFEIEQIQKAADIADA